MSQFNKFNQFGDSPIRLIKRICSMVFYSEKNIFDLKNSQNWPYL